MNVGRATNGSPVFQCKMIELPDIYNLRINKRHILCRVKYDVPFRPANGMAAAGVHLLLTGPLAAVGFARGEDGRIPHGALIQTFQ
jgi:hypothetical protein